MLAIKLYGKGVITIDVVHDRDYWLALNETVYFSIAEEMQICEALEAAHIGMADSQALLGFYWAVGSRSIVFIEVVMCTSPQHKACLIGRPTMTWNGSDRFALVSIMNLCCLGVHSDLLIGDVCPPAALW
jgi:hypothetical protein